MNAKRIDVKVFTAADSKVEAVELVPVFHGMIQRSAIKDELIIDVADYRHVANGPGVMLVGHEGLYGFEQTKGKTGLLYSLRRANVDGYKSALVYGIKHALQMCLLLEQEAALKGRIKWNGQELMVRINDRLLAPNNAQTWKAVEGDTREVLGKLFAGAYSVEPAPPSEELFTLHIKASTTASVETLLARL